MALLFNVDRTRISRHINNIFKELELDYNSNVRKTHFALSTKQVNTYSLDVILAVGYRVKSSRGIIFRRWATSVLKQYLLSGLHKHKLQFYLTKPYQQLMNTLTIFLTKNSMKAK